MSKEKNNGIVVEKFDYTNFDAEHFTDSIGITVEKYKEVLNKADASLKSQTTKSDVVKTLDEKFSKAEVIILAIHLLGVLQQMESDPIAQLMRAMGGGGEHSH